MTSSLPEILGECLEALEREGLTLDECLARYPEQREALRPLLSAALELRRAPEAAPSAEFQRVARARLLNRLPDRAAAPRRRLGWLALGWPRWQRPSLRWAASLALVIALLGGTTAAYASAGSVPGDGLYPLKRSLEEARLALTFSPVDKTQLRVEFAARRLDEAEALLQQGQPGQAEALLSTYETERAWVTQTLTDWSDPRAQALAAALAAHDARRAALAGRLWPTAIAAQVTATASATASATITPTPSATRTPSPTVTRLSSQTPTPRAYPTLIETPIVTHIVAPLPTDKVVVPPILSRYCWPAGVPTPEQWPAGWPTPDPNCEPLPIPTQICWPPGVATPDPSRWPDGVPTPDLNCWPDRRATRAAELATALPTRWPTDWPTPDPSAWPPGNWATARPTDWLTPDPGNWPTPDPSAWPTSSGNWATAWPTDWPTPDLNDRTPRRP